MNVFVCQVLHVWVYGVCVCESGVCVMCVVCVCMLVKGTT